MALSDKERKIVARKYMKAARQNGPSVGVKEARESTGDPEADAAVAGAVGENAEYETVIGDDGMVYHDYGKGDVRAFKAKDNDDYRNRLAMAKGGEDYGVAQRAAAREGTSTDFNNRARGLGAELDDDVQMDPEGDLDTAGQNPGRGPRGAGAPGQNRTAPGREGAPGQQPNGPGGVRAPEPTDSARAQLARKYSGAQKAQMREESPDLVERVKARWRKAGRI